MRGWLISFRAVILRPGRASFEHMAERSAGSFNGALLWLLTAIVAIQTSIQFGRQQPFDAFSFIALLFLLPLLALFFVFCLNSMQGRLFGGKRDRFEAILYLLVAILIPTTVLSQIVFQLLGQSELVAWLAALYPLALLTVGIHHIAKLAYWKSLAVVLLSCVLGLIGFYCLPALFFSLMKAVPGTLS